LFEPALPVAGVALPAVVLGVASADLLEAPDVGSAQPVTSASAVTRKTAEVVRESLMPEVLTWLVGSA
jgi:hypothetical protein